MKKESVRKAIFPACAVAVICAVSGITTVAANPQWTKADAFSHRMHSNGRIEYDYEGDGDLSGDNDIVIDADDIKALTKKSEIALYGEFVADTDAYGDATGTGTLYLRIGENPEQ